MLTLTFTAEDALRTRLAISPLWEVVAAVRAMRDPSRHSLHLPWVVASRAALSEVDIGLLTDLVTRSARTPDFVTVPPETPVAELADELDRLREVAPAQVRADLDASGVRHSRAVCALYDEPERGLAELAAAVERFWSAALAPHWTRLRGLLEADVFYRARKIASGGARALFADVHADVRWEAGTVRVTHRPYSHVRAARGRGLVLVPSIFAWPQVFTLTAEPWQPTLFYPARGVGTLWERDDGAANALAGVLGAGRARLLALLDSPATTTELAARTGMTTGGVSQHLAALRAAGLAVGRREGKQVFSARTELGDALVAASAENRATLGK